MERYEPPIELMATLIEVGHYQSAAAVELAFIDSFDGCADSMATEIFKSARSGDTRNLKNVINEVSQTIAYHRKWEGDLTKMLSQQEHLDEQINCLRDALEQTTKIRHTLVRQVDAVASVFKATTS